MAVKSTRVATFPVNYIEFHIFTCTGIYLTFLITRSCALILFQAPRRYSRHSWCALSWISASSCVKAVVRTASSSWPLYSCTQTRKRITLGADRTVTATLGQSPRADLHWDPPSLLSSWYHQGPEVSGQGLKLPTRLHLVRRLRIRGTTPTLPSTSSKRGA